MYSLISRMLSFCRASPEIAVTATVESWSEISRFDAETMTSSKTESLVCPRALGASEHASAPTAEIATHEIPRFMPPPRRNTRFVADCSHEKMLSTLAGRRLATSADDMDEPAARSTMIVARTTHDAQSLYAPR